MSESKKLYDDYKKRLDELQKDCKHEAVSDWTPTMWAPGHIGLPVKYCLRCGKEIERGKVE